MKDEDGDMELTLDECGRPVRRRGDVEPCVLPVGHRESWCQDERALRALDRLKDVPEQAAQGRAVLAVFGVDIGVVDAQRLAYRIAWQGSAE